METLFFHRQNLAELYKVMAGLQSKTFMLNPLTHKHREQYGAFVVRKRSGKIVSRALCNKPAGSEQK